LAATKRYLPTGSNIIFVSQGEGAPVDYLRHLYISIRESSRGQTMTEYALILAAVAVVVYAGYQSLGTHINTSVSAVDNLL
jgi:Flp pilus assembly pilin Flp